MVRLTNEPVVGSYGLFGNPVVIVDGEQFVCELHFVLPDGSAGESCCQSGGCDFCSGSATGCRFAKGNLGMETNWFY